MRFLIDGLTTLKQRPATPAQQIDRAAVRRVIELLRIAMSGDVSKAFAHHLKKLDDHREDIQKGIIAWVHLVEILIQGAEQRYPNGHGPLKLEQVRSALHHIFADEKIDIPALPSFLEPVVMDIVVEWSINALVASVDHYELWNSRTPEPWTLRGALKAAVVRLLRRLRPIGVFLGKIYVTLRYWGPLTPEIAAAVQRVQEAGVIHDKRQWFRHGYDVVIFIGQHQPQVTAGVKVFFEVVSMAERLTRPGPEKKEYARNLIRGTLQELGFPIGAGLLGAIADALIDAGIESALSLFKTRAPESFT